MGPVMPKCVNIISPKSSYTVLPVSLRTIFIATFLSDSPCILGQSLPSQTIGTSEGLSCVTVCPARRANLYPSPSDPVTEYDFPPVQTMTASKGYFLSPATTPLTLPSVISISLILSVTTLTEHSFILSASARTISDALSDTGKTLFPRSTLSGTPQPSKKSIVSAVPKRLSAA